MYEINYLSSPMWLWCLVLYFKFHNMGLQIRQWWLDVTYCCDISSKPGFYCNISSEPGYLYSTKYAEEKVSHYLPRYFYFIMTVLEFLPTVFSLWPKLRMTGLKWWNKMKTWTSFWYCLTYWIVIKSITLLAQQW